jgi:hypothetical protein
LLYKLQSGESLKSSETFNIDTREFSIQQNVILRDHRVVVPKTLRALILKELHSAYFGIVKTKSLARGHCWWPDIDRDIEKMISECTDCQNTRNNPVKAETHMWESASYAFQRVHFDFAGPFKNKYFGIIVDAYSKFPIVTSPVIVQLSFAVRVLLLSEYPRFL